MPPSLPLPFLKGLALQARAVLGSPLLHCWVARTATLDLAASSAGWFRVPVQWPAFSRPDLIQRSGDAGDS